MILFCTGLCGNQNWLYLLLPTANVCEILICHSIQWSWSDNRKLVIQGGILAPVIGKWCVPNLLFACMLIFNDAYDLMISWTYTCKFTQSATKYGVVSQRSNFISKLFLYYIQQHSDTFVFYNSTTNVVTLFFCKRLSSSRWTSMYIYWLY